VTNEDRAKGRATLEAVRSLPGDEIRSELLAQDRHPVSELRAIALEMGIRPSQKLSRDSLVQQITTTIVNDRGYRALRGEHERDNDDPCR